MNEDLSTERVLLLQAQIRFKLESLLDNNRHININDRSNNSSNSNDDDDDDNEDNNSNDNRNANDNNIKTSQLILVKETAEALVQELKLKSLKSDKTIAAKEASISQLKDEIKKLKLDNDALTKVNQNIQSDIIKNERYKKVNTVEQDLLNKSVELLKETSLSLKQELRKLQTSHEHALRKLHQSNSDNLSLSSSLQEVTSLNEKLKESANNEKLIATKVKAELATHDKQVELIRSKCHRLEGRVDKLNSDLVDSNILNSTLSTKIEELKKLNVASADTLKYAKEQHINLVNIQNEITQKKDKEMQGLIDKVANLQMLVDSKSASKTDIGVELGLELDVLIDNDDFHTTNTTSDHNDQINEAHPRKDDHIMNDFNVDTPPSKISPPAKKVTFLNTIDTNEIVANNSNSSNSNSNSNKRKAHDISTKNQDYLNNDNDTNKSSSCPSCQTSPFGLMKNCRLCHQQYHSGCAKNLPHYCKSAFICESCYHQQNND